MQSKNTTTFYSNRIELSTLKKKKKMMQETASRVGSVGASLVWVDAHTFIYARVRACTKVYYIHILFVMCLCVICVCTRCIGDRVCVHNESVLLTHRHPSLTVSVWAFVWLSPSHWLRLIQPPRGVRTN